LRYSRVIDLVGQESFNQISALEVIILGVGGVGGYALDTLSRSGVSQITVVDFDQFEITNQNRQIGSQFVGEYKVDALKKLYPHIDAINAKIDTQWVELFDFARFDFVLDCIDDMGAKVAIAHKCSQKLISSTGSARKLDPTLIRYANIWDTSGDKLAKKFRYELKKSGFVGDFECVYSQEEPKCSGLGSFVGVTGAFGLAMASRIIHRQLIDL
jgi:tRNA A37 threonylcarbamoyladenosine dehydratase